MNSMKKVMTIVGTRPEIIKLSRVIPELDKYTEHTLVHTGQNYDDELNKVFFEGMLIRQPDHYLEAAGDTAAETIGNVIIRADRVIADVKPDCVLVYGDTNSCLAALAAKRHRIPVFHMEAGNRCFDQRVPEEINRRLIDHLADINMTITEHARRYLMAEGLRPETIIKIGSSMPEVLDHYRQGIEDSDVLRRLEIAPHGYFLVSAHREENVDEPKMFHSLLDSLNAIAERFNQPVIVSTHPRTRKRLEASRTLDPNPLIRFLRPLGFLDYVHLQTRARCTISDSGTVTEEAAILNFPAVTIRQTHERPEGMDAGTLIMTGLDREDVIPAIEVVMDQFRSAAGPGAGVPDYEPRDVSRKVLRIILSYIGYVRRTVWKEY